MRKDWEYKKFEECISKVPKTPKIQSSAYNQGSKYPIISQEENALISGFCDDESLLFHIERPVVIFGDHTRALKYIDFDFAIGADGVKVILPKAFLNAKFLLYYLKWYNIPNLGYSRHYKLLKEVFVPIPTTEKQLAIVAELDKINELIQLKKQQLEDYDQLAQSIFYEMFGDPVENEKGWEVKKLGEVCETSSGGTPSKTHTEYYENGTIPWLRSGEVSQGYIYDAEIYISELGLNKSSAKIFPKDTVLIAMYGATVGEVGILCNPMCTNQAICGILPNDLYNSEFLRYVLLSHKDKYLSLASGGAQPNISQQIIKSTLIPFIDKPLQQQFAARIEAIERQKQQVSETIKDLETLLASRMQYWFD